MTIENDDYAPPIPQPSRLPLPDYEEEERSAKSKKLMALVLLTFFVAAVFIYVNPLKTGAPTGNAPGAAAALGGTQNSQAQTFDKRTYTVRDYIMSLDHTLVIDGSAASGGGAGTTYRQKIRLRSGQMGRVGKRTEGRAGEP